MTLVHRLASAAAVLAALATTPARGGDPASPDGPFDLDDLIRLAIQHDPGLIELRGEVEIAVAESRAVNDWDDPEIRLRYQEDNDVELPRPISETRSSTTREKGSSATSGNRTNGNGRTQSSRESENYRETTTTTTNRTITPGATGDRIVEETRESVSGSTNRSESGTETTAGGLSAPFSESRSEQSSGNLTSQSVENRGYDFNRLDPDSDFSARVRFRLPNPFERRPLLKRAQNKITMAESLLRAGEHAVAIEVRKSYADLLEVNGEIRSLRELGAVRTRLVKEIEEDPRAKLEDTVALADDAFRTDLELIPLSAEFDKRAFELAVLAGITDPSQIRLDSPIAPRRVDLDDLDPAFLYEVANAYRADIVELLHRASMSELELEAHNASKIPWFTYVEGFYGVDYNRGYRSNDAYGFTVGISLPLFSWFKNHEHEVYERERDSYQAQASAVGNRIRAEVELALSQLRRASSSLDRYESAYNSHRETLSAKLEEATAAGIRGTESRYRAEESLARLGERRFLALSLYNDAVLSLEAALGTTLDDVFTADAKPIVLPAAGMESGNGAGAGADAGAAPSSPPPASGPHERIRPRGAPHRR